ncbi:hypothetical protein D3C84_782080 [compost metagenome]
MLNAAHHGFHIHINLDSAGLDAKRQADFVVSIGKRGRADDFRPTQAEIGDASSVVAVRPVDCGYQVDARARRFTNPHRLHIDRIRQMQVGERRELGFKYAGAVGQGVLPDKTAGQKNLSFAHEQ